ncbi:ABC transporter ATP-binding protein [Atopobacter sp. AH10]|uniref:ABC transporter ATP-binding protein n=1 Tax=Atopobacter sp. AH10 TaxID=2315861 RepID=UPI000EF2125F|nr:ABC transporter ATP-binding protein [Atopobacter sp. AH10]RLK64005.1 ABC transporter ATP-binding protein [Atopobacter sp. AH10]
MVSLFKRLATYVKGHKRRYLTCLSLMLVASLASLAPVQAIRYLVDLLVEGDLTRNKLGLLLTVTFSSALLAYIAESLVDYCIYYGEYDIGKELRDQLYRHYISRGGLYYKRLPIGDLLTRANTDVTTMEMIMGYGVMVMLNSSVNIVNILSMMILTISPLLTLLALTPMLILGILLYFIADKIEDAYSKKQVALSSMNKKLLEIVDGIRVVRAFGVEKRIEKAFNGLTNKLRKKENEVNKWATFFEGSFPFCLAACYLLAFIGGAKLLQDGRLTVGAMMSFMIYLQMVIWPIVSLGDLMSSMQQGKASWERIEESLKITDQLTEFGQAEIADFHSLVFQDFSFRYKLEDEDVLKHIHLTIKSGEKIGIVGKTGSGKTTLVRSLLSRYPFFEAEPFINGQKISHFSRQSIRALFSYVPQEQAVFSRSIKENLTLGQGEVRDKAIEKSLKMADLWKDILRMPEGLDTLVGEKGVSLSGGQKQRLAMARAFLNKAPILILDDALSAVDVSTERHILKAIRKEASEQTQLIVSHRLTAVRDCDQIIVLDQGEIVERGRHEELMAKGQWYANQYRKQMLEEG